MLPRQPRSRTSADCSGFPARYGGWLALLLSRLSRSAGKGLGWGRERSQRGQAGLRVGRTSHQATAPCTAAGPHCAPP
jgi:hypothetical protein